MSILQASQIMVAVKDGDTGNESAPIITLSGPGLVNKGNTAFYEVRATHTPARRPLLVSALAVNTTGNFLAIHENQAQQVAITSSDKPGILAIDTVTDNQTGTEGLIKVSLVEGAGYALPKNVNEIEVDTVIFDPFEVPVISIAEPTNSIIAGSDAEFIVTAATPFIGDLAVVYNPTNQGGNFLDERVTQSVENQRSGVDRTAILSFADDGSGNYIATLSVATTLDFDNPNGTIRIVLQDDPAVQDSYTIETFGNAHIAEILVRSLPQPVITVVSTALEANEGTTALVTLEATENPLLPLTISYIPTELETNYLAPVIQDGVVKVAGDTRSEALTFTRAGPNVPWRATLSIPLKEFIAPNGTITVTLVAGSTRYSLGTSRVSTITVNEVTVPVLTIADAVITTAGSNAQFVITTNVPFVGNLDVTYIPVETGSSFLDESNGPLGEDWSSNNIRTVTLPFAQVGDEYSSILYMATEDDPNAAAGGTINLTLQNDLVDPATYTITTANNANTATVRMRRVVAVPTLSIADSEAVESEGVVTFEVTSNATSASTIMVKYQAEEVNGGNFLDESASPSQEAEQTKSLIFTRPSEIVPFKATLVVDIHNDMDSEDTGKIKVTLKPDSNPSPTYFVLADGSQDALATIWDDEWPVVVIEDAETVTESNHQHIRFPITVRHSPNRYFTILYDVLETRCGGCGDFIYFGEEGGGKWKNVDFTGNRLQSEIRIPIVSDNRREGSSTVEVRLQPWRPAAGFRFNIIPGRVSRGIITDDDSLVNLTVSAPAAGVAEDSGTVDFQITGPANRAITVLYQVSEAINSNFISSSDEGNKSTVLTFRQKGGSGPFVDTISVPIDNDVFGEASGEVTLTVLGEPGLHKTYKVPTNGTQSATATIVDDDAPVISVSNPVAVTEGMDTNIQFPLTALVSPDEIIPIHYQLSENSATDGDFIEASEEGVNKIQLVDFSNNKKTANIVIPLIQDEVAEAASTVTLTLKVQPFNLINSTYNITSPNTPATVTVNDDDALPIIRIADAANPVSENVGSVDFVVSASFATTKIIRYQASEVGSGDFLTDAQAQIKTKSLTFAQVGGSGPPVANLNVEFDNDNVGEGTGAILVTLLAETGGTSTYRVNSDGTEIAMATIWDDDLLPLLTITAPATPVVESSGVVDFVISTNTDLGSNFRVRYDPSEVAGGDFLDATAVPNQETVTEQNLDFSGTVGSYQATLSVPIHNDAIGERSGEIQVALLGDDSGAGTYKVATDGSQIVKAKIFDDDAAEIKIIASGTVTEGEGDTADFTIESAISIPSLRVNYTPVSANFIETGSGVATSAPLIFSNTFPYRSTLSIEVEDDLISETDGTIVVTLNEESTPGTTYTVASAPDNSASIAILDDDRLPVLSIAAATSTVWESSGKVDYIVTATADPGSNFRVRYKMSEVSNGNFLNEAATPTSQEAVVAQQLNFTGTSGTYTAPLSPMIHDDNVGERTGQVEIRLLPDDAPRQTYRLTSIDNQEARRVTILDDDAPELRISAGSAITEGDGNTADFTITSNVPVSTLTVFYTPLSPKFMQVGSGTKTSRLLTFTGNGPYTASLMIDVHDDTTIEGDGEVQVTLNPEAIAGTTYVVAHSPDNSAAVEVTDDDSLPVLTVSAPIASVIESSGFVDFVVSSRINPGANLRVRYKPAEVSSGDFLDENATPVNQEAEGERTLNFARSAGNFIATLRIPIHDDSIGERTGQVEVAILDDDAPVKTYLVGANRGGVARATILDNDIPELTISGGSFLTEGDGNNANFTVKSEINVTALTVFYTPLSYNFLQTGSGVKTFSRLDFSGLGPYTAPLSIPVHDDDKSEYDGVISVTLNEETTPGTSYTVATAPNNRAIVSVTDDDSLPLLTISAPSAPVAESSGAIDFTVSSIINLGSNFSVRFQASEVSGGNFLDENAFQNQEAITRSRIDFVQSTGAFTAVLPVPIHNDSVGERTGQISVSLIADDAIVQTYRVASDSSQTATATILDDDAPELKVSAGSPVREGSSETAKFTISSAVAVSSLTVFYTPVSENFLQSGSNVKTSRVINFSGFGPYTAELEFTIHDDDVEEADGAFRLILREEAIPATSYTVAPTPDNIAELAVTDDDASRPTISISPDNGSVVESVGVAKFKLMATGLKADRTVFVDGYPREIRSDFLSGSVETSGINATVNFTDPDGDHIYTGDFEVRFVKDEVGEPSSGIRLILFKDQFNNEYLLGPVTEGIIKIWDDDTPELNISAVTPTMTEADGLSADFKVTAEVSPNQVVDMRYDLTETGNFINIEGTDKFVQLDFSNNAKEDIISVPINNDMVAESNGSITLTLKPDTANPTKFTIPLAPDNSATVNVIDDDIPIISIAADNGTIEENVGAAQFNLTATSVLAASTITINATPLENSGDFLTFAIADIASEYPVTFTDSDGDKVYNGMITIPIDDDPNGEPTGSVKLRINTNTGVYRLGSTTEGIVTIRDDDGPELKIKAGDSVTEAENATADFVFSAEVSPNDLVTIRYDLAVTGDFIDIVGTIQTAQLDFSNGAKQATLSIPIVNDRLREDNGTATVTLLSDDINRVTYIVAAAPNNSATLNIIDDDSTPTISIAADSGEVRENQGPAQFKLSATGLFSTTTLSINATPTENMGDFLAAADENVASDYSVEFSDADNDNVYTGTLPVQLVNDNIGEVTGEIELQINAKTQIYQLGATTTGIITVRDDEAPELSITAGNSAFENDRAFADFNIVAEFSTNDFITLRYDLAESHNFIENEGAGRTAQLNFSDGATSDVLSIPIVRDTLAEPNGTISVTLVDDDEIPITYSIDNSLTNTATVNVTDDDSLPIIEVKSDTATAVESDGFSSVAANG